MRPGVDRPVRIVSLFPDLLGTYGDGGNVTVLRRRLEWRGLSADHLVIDAGHDVPTDADLYLIGGGEDGPQVRAADELRTSGALHRAVERGAIVFAVCAGMQILGHRFPDADGHDRDGLGLLDCTTVRVDAPRAVGELLTHDAQLVGPRSTHHLGVLTGFENHAGRTVPGPSARTLAGVEVGEGNGDGSEGIVCGTVVGTYLHGPALARNPALADALLAWVIGDDILGPIDDRTIDELRADRIRAARDHELAPRRSWRDVLRRS